MEFPVINPVKTGTKIKEYVKKKKYTVENIKDYLGMSDKSNIYKWFRGEALPSLDNLLALSLLLNVPINDMLVTEKSL